MERLTIMTPKGAALKMDATYPNETAAKKDLMKKYLVAVDRLAAYEDTGLEPETVSKIRDVVLDVSGDIDRLRELAQADKEGRCFLFPKDGMVYYIEEAGGEKWIGTSLSSRSLLDADLEWLCLSFPCLTRASILPAKRPRQH